MAEDEIIALPASCLRGFIESIGMVAKTNELVALNYNSRIPSTLASALQIGLPLRKAHRFPLAASKHRCIARSAFDSTQKHLDKTGKSVRLIEMKSDIQITRSKIIALALLAVCIVVAVIAISGKKIRLITTPEGTLRSQTATSDKPPQE